MAMTSIMTTGSDVALKLGAGSALMSDYQMEIAGLRAEAVVNVATRVDWSAAYSTLGSATKFILNDTVSSLIAIEGVAQNMTPYPSRIVAEDMINVNRDITLRNIGILRDNKVKSFVSGGTSTI